MPSQKNISRLSTSASSEKNSRISRFNPVSFIPLLGAICYPFLLMLFHEVASTSAEKMNLLQILIASFILICTLLVPVTGIVVSCYANIPKNVRRLAYACVVSPTLYVLLGVVQALVGSSIPDPWIWCIIWLLVAIWAFRSTDYNSSLEMPINMARWRVAHGICALIVCVYVIFHLGNHLVGLIGPTQYEIVMNIGRVIYRAAFIEPLLVAAFLFQVGSGLYLAWKWSGKKHDFFRTFQIASGLYLSIFILGHMNSVFIYARTYLGIETDWNFATGYPSGLIYDPWNIRLVPHYFLGVFFVLAHLATGLMFLFKAHGVRQPVINYFWGVGLIGSLIVASAIILGMIGFRI
ncbi:hypothetical protein [Acinetobacter sp. TR3]|uniref:hypothetical protein n=1 Tax=Acinetobacter sp. TR3 TaxID=3003392 RepID=UPI0022AC0F9A|nr:hypothetical protein [Acinetobacter sp. TR3]WAU76559.1 hypothetical protein O1449_15160 [Acinetobacter sp. TR3]